MGLASVRNFSKYHCVFSRVEWDSLVLAKILLGLFSQPATWPVIIAVDETLEWHEIPCCYLFGLKWEGMTLIVPLPWCNRPWALPFFSVLAPSKKSNEKAGRRHKTSLNWTRQIVKVVSRWLKRSWILLGDSAYACMDLAITCMQLNVTLISRLCLDAQLFEFAAPEKKKLDRKPIKGKRIRLKDLLVDPKQT